MRFSDRNHRMSWSKWQCMYARDELPACGHTRFHFRSWHNLYR